MAAGESRDAATTCATRSASCSLTPFARTSANGENELTCAQTTLPVSRVVVRIRQALPSKCAIAGAGAVA